MGFLPNRLRATPRIPSATYRLQFTAEFGFRDAMIILPYLKDLGISDIYSSPYLKARKGSSHGYDIVSHDGLNPEVGSEAEYIAFAQQLVDLGFGQILDIVPNHMCVEGGENSWWQDLLENGPSSVHARTFDVDWDPIKKELKNKILIPVLGDQYGNVLDNGEIVLEFGEGAFSVHYYEHRYPIIPKSYVHILRHRIDFLKDKLGNDSLPFQELLSVMTALEHLPLYTETDSESVAERYREKEVIKRRLQALYNDSEDISVFIDENVRIFNGHPGNPKSFDLLDRLLSEQVYRIAHWRVATEEINYRRFFDVNALGAIRVEDDRVFTATHSFVFQLMDQGFVTGLRVDHVDGLYDPTAYLCRLQERDFSVKKSEDGGDKQTVDRQLPSENPQMQWYVVGEKILMHGERLPRDWPVHGDTGYAFLNSVNSLFVDSRNTRKFDAIYSRFIRIRYDFPEVATETKRLVMQVSMSSEVNTLSHYLNTISERNRHTRDFTLNSLTKALVEVIAFFPIYRTYIRSAEISERDRLTIEQAVNKARRNNLPMGSFIFDFIKDVLLLRCPAGADQDDLRLRLDFVMRFQQFTGPVMAKGVEDTACYVYNRLISLNEVGGSPEIFGSLVDSFHLRNLQRSKDYPHSMNASSTHDTKRSEDVRARINVLSEIPDLWRKGLVSWSQVNRKRLKDVEGRKAPSRNEEYLLYQTLVGAWPHQSFQNEEFKGFKQRIKDYMRKAIREAKINSSWINPDLSYEDAVGAFIDGILGNRDTAFVRSFLELANYVSRIGMFNSLSQTLLKLTSPGLPDIYQGTELWDLSLVDPDNRRPVDYPKRVEILRELTVKEQQMGLSSLCGELLESMDTGAIKLFLTWKALACRNVNRDVFEQGAYTPLVVRGERAESVVAFMREFEGKKIIVAVPRFITGLLREGISYPHGQEVWGDTVIEFPEVSGQSSLLLEGESVGGEYRNVFTGEIYPRKKIESPSCSLSLVLRRFPVAILEDIPVEAKESR